MYFLPKYEWTFEIPESWFADILQTFFMSAHLELKDFKKLHKYLERGGGYFITLLYMGVGQGDTKYIAHDK